MMRHQAVLLIVGSLALSGCIFGASQTSVYPFVPESQAIDLPGIDGFWVEAKNGDDPATLEIRRSDDRPVRELSVGELGKDATEAFALSLAAMGDHLVWDMVPDPPSDGLAAQQLLPLHSLARLRLENDRLEVAFLDAEWVSARCIQGDLDLEHLRLVDDGAEAKDDDLVILTALTRDLRPVIEDLLDDDEAFGETTVFVRRREPAGGPRP